MRQARFILPFDSVAGVNDDPRRFEPQPVRHPNDHRRGHLLVAGKTFVSSKQPNQERKARNKEAATSATLMLAHHMLIPPARHEKRSFICGELVSRAPGIPERTPSRPSSLERGT